MFYTQFLHNIFRFSKFSIMVNSIILTALKLNILRKVKNVKNMRLRKNTPEKCKNRGKTLSFVCRFLNLLASITLN